jgi:hypothetical protein
MKFEITTITWNRSEILISERLHSSVSFFVHLVGAFDGSTLSIAGIINGNCPPFYKFNLHLLPVLEYLTTTRLVLEMNYKNIRKIQQL